MADNETEEVLTIAQNIEGDDTEQHPVQIFEEGAAEDIPQQPEHDNFGKMQDDEKQEQDVTIQENEAEGLIVVPEENTVSEE